MEQRNENPSAVGKTKPHSPGSPKRNCTNLFSELNIKGWGEKTHTKSKYVHITDFTMVFNM